MTKKERDNLIERLENFIPDAETFVEGLLTEDIKAGRSPGGKYAYMSGVLKAKINALVEDLKCRDL